MKLSSAIYISVLLCTPVCISIMPMLLFICWFSLNYLWILEQQQPPHPFFFLSFFNYSKFSCFYPLCMSRCQCLESFFWSWDRWLVRFPEALSFSVGVLKPSVLFYLGFIEHLRRRLLGIISAAERYSLDLSSFCFQRLGC